MGNGVLTAQILKGVLMAFEECKFKMTEDKKCSFCGSDYNKIKYCGVAHLDERHKSNEVNKMKSCPLIKKGVKCSQ
jgi:hypothetical protein